MSLQHIDQTHPTDCLQYISQHKALFNEIDKRNWEPREQMLNDLQKTINKWRRNQEQVILMMDCNEDVRSSRMRKFLDDVGMKEAIHDRHGSNAPATYIEGQLPIDGLFATSAITIRAGGYISFDQGIQGQRTDHQCLWIDLDITSIFGSEVPPLMRFQGRRVKSKHP